MGQVFFKFNYYKPNINLLQAQNNQVTDFSPGKKRVLYLTNLISIE